MATFTLDRTGLLARVETHLKQAAGTVQQLSTSLLGDVDVCIDDALTEFSKDASGTDYERLADDPSPLAQGNGTTSLTFSAVAPYWIEGLSQIRAFEYEVDQVPPIYWQERNFRRDATKTKLLLAAAPASGADVRLVYTTKHTVSGLNEEVATTVSEAAWPALAHLAAAYCAEALAAHYAHNTSQASYGADIASFTSKSDECLRVAGILRRRYRDLIGQASDGEASADVAIGRVNWDLDTQHGGAYFARVPGAD